MSNHKNKCVLGMRNLSVADLIQEAQKRQTALSLPVFSGIVPQPSAVNVVIQQLIIVNQQCLNRNFSFIPQRNQLVSEVLGMIGLQCESINTLAQGNLDILVLSSFPLHKPYGFRPIPSAGVMLTIKAGREAGEISVRAQADKEKRYYHFEVLQADGVVISHISQKSKTVIPAVAQNMDIAVRVCVCNSRGMGMWSDYLRFVTPRAYGHQQNNNDSSQLKIA